MFLELFALLNVTSILELIGVEPHHRDHIATNIEAGIEYLIGKTYGLDNPEITILTWYCTRLYIQF